MHIYKYMIYMMNAYVYVCIYMSRHEIIFLSCLWANLTCWPQFSSRAGGVRDGGWVLGRMGHEHLITNLKGAAFLMDLQWDSFTKLSCLTAVVLKLKCVLESPGGLWKQITLLHPRVSDSLSLRWAPMCLSQVLRGCRCCWSRCCRKGDPCRARKGALV